VELKQTETGQNIAKKDKSERNKVKHSETNQVKTQGGETEGGIVLVQLFRIQSF
jgi:hypothetical protein